MERVADSFATFITFLVFLFIILAPMLMAFVKNKQESRRASRADKKKKKKAPREGVSFFDAIRRDDRISEPRVTFTEERSEDRSVSRPAEGGAARPGQQEEEKESVRLHFEEKGEAFYKPLSERFTAIGEEVRPEQAAEGPRAGTHVQPSRFTGRLARLPELKRAVVLSEVLGKPKGLRE
ncbi:MAG: hypothetical protein SVR04_14100 [Spirochaetota bacterium]|nr:hypothetical protein [Spirochaetota bacterium]